MKLVEKIEPKGMGLQLKEKILKRHTIEELAEMYGVKPGSIKKELESKLITNGKFKKWVADLFEVPFDQLAISVEQQMINDITSIKNNISHYNKGEHTQVLEDQYKYALEECTPYYQLMARGNLAIYQYNMGLHFYAIKMLDEVIEAATEKGIKELVVYYSVQLAFVYSESDLEKSKNALYRAEVLVNETLPKDVLYSYHHFYGVVLKLIDKQKEAREQFRKARDFATNLKQETKAISNIGLSFYREGKYRKALSWTKMALDVGADDVEIRCTVLNNIANIYYKKGEIGKAHLYLGDALKCLTPDLDVGTTILVHDTFIKLNRQDSQRVLNFLLKILENKYTVSQYQFYLVKCVKRVFDILKEKGEVLSVKKLEKRLKKYIRSEGEKRPLDELSIVAYRMILYLEDEGVYQNEETN